MSNTFEARYEYVADEYEPYTKLVITTDEGVLAEYEDCMEREDATFIRDLKWVANEINRAYRLGRLHEREDAANTLPIKANYGHRTRH